MLEKSKAGKLEKKEFKTLSKPLKSELFRLQQSIKSAQLPVIIIFEGFGGAGKVI